MSMRPSINVSKKQTNGTCLGRRRERGEALAGVEHKSHGFLRRSGVADAPPFPQQHQIGAQGKDDLARLVDGGDDGGGGGGRVVGRGGGGAEGGDEGHDLLGHDGVEACGGVGGWGTVDDGQDGLSGLAWVDRYVHVTRSRQHSTAQKRTARRLVQQEEARGLDDLNAHTQTLQLAPRYPPVQGTPDFALEHGGQPQQGRHVPDPLVPEAFGALEPEGGREGQGLADGQLGEVDVGLFVCFVGRVGRGDG